MSDHGQTIQSTFHLFSFCILEGNLAFVLVVCITRNAQQSYNVFIR